MMSFKIPECPKSTDELDMLIYALTSEKFDKTPEELQRELEELKEKLRRKGTSETMIQVYDRFFQFREDDEEARAYMLRWGRNRGQAIRNYIAHFKQPCNQCVDVYIDILADHAFQLMHEEGVDIKDMPERVDEFLLKAHLYYLGNPALDTGGKIKLDDILRHPN